jgi:hypothetical protein
MRPQDDPSWAAYPNTILELFGTRVVRLDLRSLAAPEDVQPLREVGLAAPWAVVTAWNPHGLEVDEHTNRANDQRLRATLEAAGHRGIRADGVSPDGLHREEGVAVALSLEEARGLAESFGQSAFFWFDGECVWLMPALMRAEPRRLSRSA